ncbi:hypothetical protein [Bat Hp-betacoronavirus/Zhejiang2013]|uniref:Uncharacterized protein n=1 Tax=Bat Hp-betacoronavirus/Zhejiang2013 TaxID=1541205 RepID=A0A088DJH7_9BETC|nr:ORF7 protein [Bat Hp-betacoronavirus/Zhejiang2013]AIL94220.1 hypothetical protein [Bat Hp-betacoronavirus/Zhejiang2013]
MNFKSIYEVITLLFTYIVFVTVVITNNSQKLLECCLRLIRKIQSVKHEKQNTRCLNTWHLVSSEHGIEDLPV